MNMFHCKKQDCCFMNICHTCTEKITDYFASKPIGRERALLTAIVTIEILAIILMGFGVAGIGTNKNLWKIEWLNKLPYSAAITMTIIGSVFSISLAILLRRNRTHSKTNPQHTLDHPQPTPSSSRAMHPLPFVPEATFGAQEWESHLGIKVKEPRLSEKQKQLLAQKKEPYLLLLIPGNCSLHKILQKEKITICCREHSPLQPILERLKRKKSSFSSYWLVIETNPCDKYQPPPQGKRLPNFFEACVFSIMNSYFGKNHAPKDTIICQETVTIYQGTSVPIIINGRRNCLDNQQCLLLFGFDNPDHWPQARTSSCALPVQKF